MRDGGTDTGKGKGQGGIRNLGKSLPGTFQRLPGNSCSFPWVWGWGHSWEFLQEQRPQKLLWEVSDSLGKIGKFQRKIHLNQTFCFWGFYLIWVSSLIPNMILRNPSLLLPFGISSQTWREQNRPWAHRKTSQERKKGGNKIPIFGESKFLPQEQRSGSGNGNRIPKKPRNSKPGFTSPFPKPLAAEGALEGLQRKLQRGSKADRHSLEKSLQNSQSLSPSSKAALLLWKFGNCFPFTTQGPWNSPDLFLQSLRTESCQEFFCSREFSHISQDKSA